MQTFPKKWSIGNIAGIFLIFIYCIFMLISMALYPLPFSPFTNWLSDFGNSLYSPNGAIYYSLGVILTGIVSFPFWIGLYTWYSEKKVSKFFMIISQCLGVIVGISLIMTGIYPEEFLEQHAFWSDILWICLANFLMASAITYYLHGKFRRLHAVFGLILGAVTSCSLEFS